VQVRLAEETKFFLANGLCPHRPMCQTWFGATCCQLSPLPQGELAALERSVAELGAIGRTLSQLACLANKSGNATGPGEKTSGQCSRSRRLIRAMYRGSIDTCQA